MTECVMEERLKTLRDAGWRVAIHNDYFILGGTRKTFWLFTHPNGTWIKGEAETDATALALCIIEAEKKT